MKRQPTPLDMLMAEQRRVRESCRVQEQKINEDFKFIHDHSGRILFAGISSLFFSKRREPVENDEKKETEEQNPMLGMMFKNIPPYYGRLLCQSFCVGEWDGSVICLEDEPNDKSLKFRMKLKSVVPVWLGFKI